MKNIFRGALILSGIGIGFYSAFNAFTKDSKGLKIAGVYFLFYVVSGVVPALSTKKNRK